MTEQSTKDAYAEDVSRRIEGKSKLTVLPDPLSYELIILKRTGMPEFKEDILEMYVLGFPAERGNEEARGIGIKMISTDNPLYQELLKNHNYRSVKDISPTLIKKLETTDQVVEELGNLETLVFAA